jgi:hypothetical protein
MVTIIGALFVSSAAMAKTAARGVGTTSCAQFAQDYRRSPRTADIVYMSWAEGFMSGWNAGALSDQKALRDLGVKTAEDESRAIRYYCDAHPLASFLDAVLDVYFSLPSHPPAK